MRRHAWRTVAAVLAFAAGTSAGAASHESFRLVGQTGAAWLLVRQDNHYRLAVKPIDRPWESPWTRRSGRVVAATGIRDSVVLFFARGEHVRYFPYRPAGQPGINAPKELWPAGTVPEAACPAGGSKFDAMLVLVKNPRVGFQATRPAATAPTAAGSTRPASAGPARRPAPTRGPLAVLRYAGGKWQRLAVVPARFVASAFRARIALHDGVVYVLLDQKPTPVLIALEGPDWRRIGLPAAASASRPLAMVGMPEGLVLAMFDHDGRVGVTILALGKWTKTQTVRRGQAQAAWPKDSPPAIARLGSRLAVMWREGESWFFGTCGPDAKLAARQVEIFRNGLLVAQALRIVWQFLAGVLVLIVGLMFWPGQPLRLVPFSLPPTVFPARLGKRAVALVIDVLPFMVLSSLVLGGGADTPELLEKFRKGSVPPWSIYANLAFLTAYPLYCIFMEHRYGATLGKLVMRLRVVADGGRRPVLREVVLRNVSKIPEVMALVMVIPILFPVLTRYHQRLGDKIAWTAVIDAELTLPPDVPKPSDEQSSEGDSGREEKS